MGKGFKVLVCGMCSVGKTAILEQVLYGNHTIGEECSRTMEDVYVAMAETDRGLKEQLRLYDTQGLQGDEDFPKHYYSMADGFVLVYAVNSLESFEKVNWLKKEIDKFREKKEWPIIVLGNKTDLLEERQVQSEIAQQWARIEMVKLWEVTVADRRTMMEPFVVLASKLYQSQNKLTFSFSRRRPKCNKEDY
ncbi:NF-kappa-B inhibitor-interacting Ras-like protein 1 [Pseudonaja textilis]|uniref:NF-kappa-B inhibitor-interacting Ras-like protein 1 n=1 Tax=Pseudonaja textilis TaxID=8673 RepID=UPI000EA89153|nr:NF-kappa-B inhibitor-interacting Ras-like protein 1 [Pseudonaja textilis]